MRCDAMHPSGDDGKRADERGEQEHAGDDEPFVGTDIPTGQAAMNGLSL